jgi:hypothetical protein
MFLSSYRLRNGSNIQRPMLAIPRNSTMHSWMSRIYVYWLSKHDFYIRWCSNHLKITPPMILVDQELLSSSEHLSSLSSFRGDSCCSIYSFQHSVVSLFVSPLSFGHCLVSSSIYEFWLPLWYYKTFLQM